MIDYRPLWMRALTARGSMERRRAARARVFMESTRQLTGAQFVDLVRALIGQKPLYAAALSDRKHRGACGGYEIREALLRAADPDCDRCGGSGYFDGERLDMRCPCAGPNPIGARVRVGA